MIFMGDDWSEDHHDVYLMDQAGKRLASRRLPEGLTGIRQLHELIASHAEEPEQAVIGIETDRGVTTTLAELKAASGVAVTGGGTLLPMSTVIRMASHAHHYLAVFNRHTEVPLYLGRTRRCASPGQRIVLYAKDRGCTRPGCTVPAYWTHVHHASADWDEGGHTNITDLTHACRPDNLLVENSGWTTRKRKDGRTEMIPPHNSTSRHRRATRKTRVLLRPGHPRPGSPRICGRRTS